MVASGAYNFFNPTYEASADVKGSGESAVRIKFGELVDTLQDVRLKFAEAKELEKVEYITFYIKNECDLPLDVIRTRLISWFMTRTSRRRSRLQVLTSGRKPLLPMVAPATFPAALTLLCPLTLRAM